MTALDSGQMALESCQLALDSGQMALDSRQMALESRQLPLDSWQMALESRHTVIIWRQKWDLGRFQCGLAPPAGGDI
jgi:hypothetical protein